MKILSHRGYWKNKQEKNSITAFNRSFLNSYGLETDLRDMGGGIVVSHDMASENCLKLEDFFKLYKKYNTNLPLALNIKADGLQIPLKKLIQKYKITNYFVFDMSVPDALLYIDLNFNVFTRQSEYEKEPSFYDKACGIWMDEFYSHWIDKNTIKKHIDNGKSVCIVSSELHKRDYKKEWQEYKQIEKELHIQEQLMICTDYPDEARRFFND
ncbi:hypothetical protein FW619_02655 [Campylobacter jejuni]|uniref:hypothetical protein n=1 Tax=Campylobacter jejuni TaxID=197 RepID=UPI0012D1BC30|nr:hypothetical protein [Campylobacter jejuni]ECR1906796.1 hypothetical protein [Campylobacter jejuni]EDP4782144.1 hypothetical protein [Campylobacter jejuni]GML59739.1 hypothetical protein B10440_14800 [Campylobacter jejuni]HDV6527277.1 hypothetical protein [Campylobacter jejuni]HEF2527465.1 hypothetical protein [Campylobacter jejuni]